MNRPLGVLGAVLVESAKPSTRKSANRPAAKTPHLSRQLRYGLLVSPTRAGRASRARLTDKRPSGTRGRSSRNRPSTRMDSSRNLTPGEEVCPDGGAS